MAALVDGVLAQYSFELSLFYAMNELGTLDRFESLNAK